MTTRTIKRPKRVMHPGSACCDLTQDLAGWIERETARINRMRRWCRVWHQRGRRLRAASIRAAVRSDSALADRLAGESVYAHGMGNAHGQSIGIREGHLERVIEAHQWRLGGAA